MLSLLEGYHGTNKLLVYLALSHRCPMHGLTILTPVYPFAQSKYHACTIIDLS